MEHDVHTQTHAWQTNPWNGICWLKYLFSAKLAGLHSYGSTPTQHSTQAVGIWICQVEDCELLLNASWSTCIAQEKHIMPIKSIFIDL